jgi:histidyl-tRNA synthetase
MKDILPEQAVRWQWLEARFRAIAALYGYSEVRTPLLEATELFVREIGAETDVVAKEMYSFERHGDLLTVRPEGTAGAARAYVQHAVHAREPVSRWYYLGPMFRAERPAKGRLRQFHQAGCEIYGDPGPLCDAEMIDMCLAILRAFGIDDVAVHVNSIGSGAVRERYREALRSHFAPHAATLSEDSQRRLETNPLRILDSKAPEDQAAVALAPTVLDLLDGEDSAHFAGLCRSLDTLGVPYEVDGRLVRGLDYYTRTLFELRIKSDALGAQSALAGGGRYDDMIESLGAKRAVPAIGFAMGLERILTLVGEEGKLPAPGCYFAPLSDQARDQALLLARELRGRGVACEVDGRGGSLKAMLRRANALESRLCVLLGDEELGRGVLAVKDLARHTQDEVPLAGAAETLATRLEAGGS